MDVGDSTVDVVDGGVASMDPEPIHKLHGLCSLPPELARYNDLTPFSIALHDETKHSIASSVIEQCSSMNSQAVASTQTVQSSSTITRLRFSIPKWEE